MQNNRAVGSRYEAAVAAFLEKKGWRILERNFRCKMGEIDLIARDGGTICFVEVKYRASEACGNPAEAVDRHKKKRISNAASYFLYSRRYPTDTPCRFDIAAVGPGGIRLIKNAFDYAGSFRI